MKLCQHEDSYVLPRLKSLPKLEVPTEVYGSLY